VRTGDDLFVSGYERILGAPPMNDCRWALWQRTADGWQRRQADATGRTREPSPLACLPGGRLLLSANPTLLPPDAAGGGPALRLLTSVVSVCHDGFVTVDAGLKALYQDGGRPQVFGEMAGRWQYDWWGDEYGRITYADQATAPALGSVLELIPSHCDPTINLFDRFHLVRGNVAVGEWEIDLRGCSQ